MQKLIRKVLNIKKIYQKKKPDIYLESIEKSSERIIEDGITVDPVIVDGGANQGWSVDVYLKRWPKARIIAVEPLPGLAKQLQKKYYSMPNVSIEEGVLWKENGKMTVNECQKMVASSLLDPVDGANQFWGAEFYGIVKNHEVSAYDIESLMIRHNLDKIDILKLDLQGAEFSVLDGASQKLKSGAIQYVLCEVLFRDMYKKQGSAGEIFDYMKSCGYSIRGTYDPLFVKGNLVQMDVLFRFN